LLKLLQLIYHRLLSQKWFRQISSANVSSRMPHIWLRHDKWKERNAKTLKVVVVNAVAVVVNAVVVVVDQNDVLLCNCDDSNENVKMSVSWLTSKDWFMSEVMEERSDLMITFGLFLSPSRFFNSTHTHARENKLGNSKSNGQADKLYINYQLKRQIDNWPLEKKIRWTSRQTNSTLTTHSKHR